jgi:hypothetical protein
VGEFFRDTGLNKSEDSGGKLTGQVAEQ